MSRATPDLRRLVEVALPAARERQKVLLEIRRALEEGDDQAALSMMRRFVGLPPDVRRLP